MIFIDVDIDIGGLKSSKDYIFYKVVSLVDVVKSNPRRFLIKYLM